MSQAAIASDLPAPPFAAFREALRPQGALRDAITRHMRAPEAECVEALLPAATLDPAEDARAAAQATRLVEALRGEARSRRPGLVDGLLREYDLSSPEGLALMCLAEALLRIPDAATSDELIRDKLGGLDWRAHFGRDRPLGVNAATAGLLLAGPAGATRLGAPMVRRAVKLAMRGMGRHFVAGETIGEALRHARRLERQGWRHSYDMLGEAAVTAADAERYFREYEGAVRAIGAASGGRGLNSGPGISVKLSALHPRYARAQRERVMAELLPRLRALAVLARRCNIGLNIDAEEADRLELSLDLVEALCTDPALAGWDGIGFVVQAYGKRAPAVLDWLIDLARRSGHRLMIRLVKGAYWDSEIKRAQVDGLVDYPVFTRKQHTDVSYLACARRMLAAPDAVFAQFATHNARTVASIHAMAGADFHIGQYEFQCLHGMGEGLYRGIVGAAGGERRPVRIYAPVGTHETLLAYLVRRLLENGSNSSFVNRVQDPSVAVADLVADPVAAVARTVPRGGPHPRIARPRDLFAAGLAAPGRANSAGLDLTDERTLARLAATLEAETEHTWRASPPLDGARQAEACEIRNPADRRCVVGLVVEAAPAEIEAALARATDAAPGWAATPPADRASCLARAADLLEQRMGTLLGLVVREAGKTLPNAVAEIREAVDFLRYYGAEAEARLEQSRLEQGRHAPLGVVVCISPWNFPLAIFTGQVAAALAAGNAVVAKPAVQTPLIAAAAVALLHEAGVPADALLLLPGEGAVGAHLVADPRVAGMVFTGSTEVARNIRRELARRLDAHGRPVPLIAETGGQNAMVVDSAALTEQVVADVIQSAFDSAGQRCSALRVLCLADAIADRTLAMLRGAMAELAVGSPDRLATDIGPVIDAEARARIERHLDAMRTAGHPVHQAPLPAACAQGTFVAPAIVELDGVADLAGEVFGPVLHVVRFRAGGLDRLLADIGGLGYGLTFGLHTRIDATIRGVLAHPLAGNVYVNRNLVGAVVGVQPFGGHGLSGTGPKAGGPLYLRRLLAAAPHEMELQTADVPAPALAWAAWRGVPRPIATPVGLRRTLPGPVGETNIWETAPRGTVLCVASDARALDEQIAAALLTGNRALVPGDAVPAALPEALRGWILGDGDRIDAALFSGTSEGLLALEASLAARPGPLVAAHVRDREGRYPLEWLVVERCVSTNTAAAGGNAHLMAIG